MLRKAFKLTAASLVIGSALVSSAYAGGHTVYKDAVAKPNLPINSAFIGYSFMHHYYNDAWEDSYRTVTGTSPENNYSGIDIGLNHMVNNWLALHMKYARYFRKGSNGNDGRISGLTVGGMGFYNMSERTWFLGMIGANVGVLSHEGDKNLADGTNTNPAFTDADVSLALSAGFQFQVANNFYIRPLVNLLPFQDRADGNTSLGFSLDFVFGLS